MKTAISLPDEVFEEAEQLARRLKVSRSALFAEAVAEYVARHEPGRPDRERAPRGAPTERSLCGPSVRRAAGLRRPHD